MNLEELKIKYDKLQQKYGEKSLDSIYFGGCINNPKICFVFMNPTGRNIASEKSWDGPKSPWIGTKNIWTLFYKVGLLKEETYNKIKSMKSKEWTVDFAKSVYKEVEDNKYFITNLGKCTQIDARPLPDEVYKKYLKLFLQEIEIVNPDKIILFGNQVSKIVLNQNIKVSETRKQKFIKKINNKEYECYCVHYPIGNGIFNIDKSIEDILYILNNGE